MRSGALKNKGANYELPIIGNRIAKLIYDGMTKVLFDDEYASTLEIHAPFTVIRYNQPQTIVPAGKDALDFFYNHMSRPVTEATAFKNGSLRILFGTTELYVEDGPFENWHFTRIVSDDLRKSVHVHGGIGRVTF